MQTSLGCNVKGAALPICDVADHSNQLAAVVKRIGAVLPPIVPRDMRFRRTVARNFLRSEVDPLCDDDVLPFDQWVETINHTENEKAIYRRSHREFDVMPPKAVRLSGFVKTETYNEYKYPRGIHPRGNAADKRFNCEVGPVVSAIEERLYSTEYFIKHVPVCERPRWIQQRLGKYKGDGWRFYGTDHSSFEAAMVPEVMCCDELQLYAYMLRGTKHYAPLMALLHALPGDSKIRYSTLSVSVPGVRMSGDMVTSLGNGFTNLVAMAAVCESKGLQWDGFVEGDDGLFAVNGEVTDADFARFGHKIKMVQGTELSEMGFCKLYYTTDNFQNVVDPAELLCKFGWSHSRCRFGSKRTRDMLLRAKADSLEAEVPRCPIVKNLVNYVRRVVGEGERRYNKGKRPDVWQHEFGRTHREMGATSSERELCSRLFGLTPEDQESIEGYLDSLTSLQELDHPAILGMMKPCWKDYYDRFVADVPEGAGAHPAF